LGFRSSESDKATRTRQSHLSQPYALMHPEKTIRPFVAVIQDKFMRVVTKKVLRVMHGH
jgi:hypothetical protein